MEKIIKDIFHKINLYVKEARAVGYEMECYYLPRRLYREIEERATYGGMLVSCSRDDQSYVIAKLSPSRHVTVRMGENPDLQLMSWIENNEGMV